MTAQIYVPPSYSRDYAPLFLAAMDLPDPDRITRLLELLEAMRMDDRKSEAWAAELWSEVLESHAIGGRPFRFFLCSLRMIFWEPIRIRRWRLEAWVWRGSQLREVLGRSRGTQVWIRSTLGLSVVS